MNISFRVLLLLAIAGAVAGCSKPKQPQANGNPGSTNSQAGFKAVDDAPEAFRVKADSFARRMERDILEKKQQNVRAYFDRVAIVDGVCEGISAQDRRLTQFKDGLQRGMQNGIQQLAKTWSEQVPKYKHLVIYQGELAARFRFVSDKQGIALVDFVLRTNRLGDIVIADLCNHAMGYDMVEQTRRTAAPLLAELDKSFIERLVNKPDVSLAEMRRFGDMSKKANAGDYAGAIAAYKSLPDSMRNTMAATGIYIMVLQNSDDMEAYKAALKEAAVRFKSANFQLMLVDVYALDKQFSKAAACAEAFMNYLEKDAALLTLKGLMLNAAGDVSGARAALREAFELEPDCEYAHSKGLDVLLAAKDFKGVRDSILFLEKNSGYSFKGNLDGPLWKEFRDAPESAAWR